MAPRSLKIKYLCDWSLFVSPALFSFCHRLCANAFPGVSESPTLSLTLSLLHNLVLTLVVSILSYQVGFFYLQFSAERFIVRRSMSLSLQTSLTFAFNDPQYVPLFSLIPHHTSLYTGLSLLGKWEDVGEDCVFLNILFSEFVMSRYLFSWIKVFSWQRWMNKENNLS